MKLIINFFVKVILSSVGCSLVAVGIWFFFSVKTIGILSSLLFWCGAAFIVIAILLFAGHSDVDLAPHDFGTAGAIDPKDMAYGKNLLHLSQSLFVIMVLAGCLVIATSILLAKFF